MDMEQLKMFEPWFFEMFLTETPEDYSPELGIDMHFLNQVKENQQVIELEGVKEQIKQHDEFPNEVQVWLLEGALDYHTQEESVEDLVDAWKSGDEEELVSILRKDDDGSEEYDVFMESFLYKRNENMATKIKGYLTDKKKETYFIVVGAAHYVGEKGIIQILENQGYQVEKVLK
jgi:uncharacterized protein YbaP (TraB family)